jgi:hypothetical protein
MAYKLLCFTGSNRPKGHYKFDTLIRPRFLNLERQLKKQHKARVLESIIKGGTELVDKGHLKIWGYDEGKDLFFWEYTDKVIKHPESTTSGKAGGLFCEPLKAVNKIMSHLKVATI